MTEENDPKVIQGPWPKSGRKVKIPDDNSMQLQDDIEFAEELTQTVIVQMIHTMGENGIHVTEESFIRDIGFIIEVTKGVILLKSYLKCLLILNLTQIKVYVVKLI